MRKKDIAERYTLTEKQTAALRARFGANVALDEELKAAHEYATGFHQGRPYANYGRFCWNWMLRSERWNRQRRTQVSTGQPVSRVEQSELSLDELTALLDDELETVREGAAEILRERRR